MTTLPRSPQEIQAAATQFDLTPFADNFEELKVLKLEADIAKKRYELFRDRLKARTGNADELLINGQLVATNAVNGAFQTSRFIKEQPHIAESYMAPVTRLEFDYESFAQEHPGLATSDAYRARTLRIK